MVFRLPARTIHHRTVHDLLKEPLLFVSSFLLLHVVQSSNLLRGRPQESEAALPQSIKNTPEPVQHSEPGTTQPAPAPGYHPLKVQETQPWQKMFPSDPAIIACARCLEFYNRSDNEAYAFCGRRMLDREGGCNLNIWGLHVFFPHMYWKHSNLSGFGACYTGGDCPLRISPTANLDACRSCPGFPVNATSGVCYGLCSGISKSIENRFLVVSNGQLFSNDNGSQNILGKYQPVLRIHESCLRGTCEGKGFVNPFSIPDDVAKSGANPGIGQLEALAKSVVVHLVSLFMP